MNLFEIVDGVMLKILFSIQEGACFLHEHVLKIGLELLLAILLNGVSHVEDLGVLLEGVLALLLEYSLYFEKTHFKLFLLFPCLCVILLR